MSDIHVVILAAGKGTRMKSAVPKVLHRAAGIPMLDYVLKTAAALKPQSVTAVVGHKADALASHLAAQPGLRCVVQEPQLGTAHALLTAQPALATATGTLLVLSGDVPLLRAQTLKELIDRHLQTSARATIVTAVVERPAGYGRILRNGERIARIVEERDATADERAIGEINSGIYAFALGGLFEALRGVATSNVQREYYLPDLVAIHVNRGDRVETLRVTDADEILGINNREDLEAVSRVLRSRKNNELMAAASPSRTPPPHTSIRMLSWVWTPSFIRVCRSKATRRSAGNARSTLACASSTRKLAIGSSSSTTASLQAPVWPRKAGSGRSHICGLAATSETAPASETSSS